MKNEELIDGLRWCADESICCDDFSGEKCPYYDEKKDSCSVDEILHAAADALEAADEKIADYIAAIEALDDSNDAYIKENEQLKKRIAGLEAEVERLKALNEELREKQTYIDNYGDAWAVSGKDVLTVAYNHGFLDGEQACNCGAKMRKGEER